MLLLSDRRMDEKSAALLSPLQLAYIGDAVWETFVRQELALQRLNVHHMHNECIRMVNAKAQADYLAQLQNSLNQTEASIAQRGRNAHARHPAPRNQNPADYADATAFEALIGYLYISDQHDRLKALLYSIRIEDSANPPDKAGNYQEKKADNR